MKTILLIYYNPNRDNFYFRWCQPIELSIYNFYVGFKNSYGHEIIGILLFYNHKTIPLKSYYSYIDFYYNNKKKANLKNVLIDKTIYLLNKLKK